MKRLFDQFRRRFSSPRVIPKGNHEENLAAHPHVDLEPLGMVDGLQVPVWVDVAPEHPTPHTYDGLLWEVEPCGEYIYHLAGDFPKNEKGLLRYSSAKVMSEVHVSFETDAIDAAQHDQPIYAGEARAAARDDTDLAGLTVAEAQNLLAQGNNFALLRGAPEHSHIEARAFVTPADKTPRQSITLTTCLIATDMPRGRMTLIRTSCGQPDLPVSALAVHHLHLVERYHNIAHLPLTGAIRM